MERLQNARYLYSLAKVVLAHPHIPESSYTKGTAIAGDQLRVSGAFTTGKRWREVFNLPARILLEGNENTARRQREYFSSLPFMQKRLLLREKSQVLKANRLIG